MLQYVLQCFAKAPPLWKIKKISSKSHWHVAHLEVVPNFFSEAECLHLRELVEAPQ